MAKGNGTTRSVGSGAAGAPRTSGRGSRTLSKVQSESEMGMSERVFFNYTGYKYGHPVGSYEEGLSVLNKLPNDAVLHTGHRAGEAKEYLKKMIRILKS